MKVIVTPQLTKSGEFRKNYLCDFHLWGTCAQHLQKLNAKSANNEKSCHKAGARGGGDIRDFAKMLEDFAT
jgi:hypothetical protein